MRVAWVCAALLAGGCGGQSPPAPAVAPPPAVAPVAGPEWAPGLTHGQARLFLGVVLGYFAGRGEKVQIEDGWVVPQAEGQTARFGLTNVAQRCAAAPQAEWPQVVADHFESIRKIQSDQGAWKEQLKSWATAKSFLRLRLYPQDYASQPGMAKVLRRVDLPDTLTMVVFDLPKAIQTVTSEDVAAWKVESSDVWKVATANERRLSIPPPEELDMGSAGTLLAFNEDSYFVSSLALRLDQLPGDAPPHGWLVAVPTRDLVMAYGVRDLKVLNAISRLAELVPKMEAKGPGSVSPNLFWWDGTSYHILRVRRQGDQIAAAPSEAFTRLLNKLAAAEGSGK